MRNINIYVLLLVNISRIEEIKSLLAVIFDAFILIYND
jgi:hypothetical protein